MSFPVYGIRYWQVGSHQRQVASLPAYTFFATSVLDIHTHAQNNITFALFTH